LLKDILQAVGADLNAVMITELRDGVYYADLRFGDGVSVSARPSDAIALAIRSGTVIYAEESVLDAAGITIPDEQESEVERFREFLDQISPEDFETEAP
jgi:bifunctional DNase/RNase